MRTILPKKAGQEIPLATDDEHHEMLAADPTVPQFPQGTPYGAGPSTGPTYSPNMGNGPMMQSQPSQPILTSAAPTNAASGADVLVEHDKESADFINKKWRPLMAFVYMITCTADFVLFPILWSLLQAMSNGSVTAQWQPLTLQGAGLYHIAMGAVLGVAAYGRTKEKLEGKQ
jgi:hypothetical protein